LARVRVLVYAGPTCCGSKTFYSNGIPELAKDKAQSNGKRPE